LGGGGWRRIKVRANEVLADVLKEKEMKKGGMGQRDERLSD